MNVSRNSQFFVVSLVGASLIGGCDTGASNGDNNPAVQNPVGGNVSVSVGGQPAVGQGGAVTAAGGSVVAAAGGSVVVTAGGSAAVITGCVNGASCTANCTTSSGETCYCGSIAKTLTCVGVVAATGGTSSVPLASTVAPCTTSTVANKTNGAFAKIPLGSYFVSNNVWGDNAAEGAATSQYVWSTCNNGSAIGWGASFTWPGTGSAVKSYQSTVLGWHWGWPVSIGSTGMPVQVGSKNINCSWTYAVTRNGTVTMNVAYDLWVHSVALKGESDEWKTVDTGTGCTYGNCAAHKPTDEIMIWLYKSNGAGPISSTGSTPYAANVSLGGSTWDLYEGVITDGWNVHSYVRQANADTGATLNLQLFLKDLVTRGRLTNSKYLSSIEAGTEVYNGAGQLDTSSYGCAIE